MRENTRCEVDEPMSTPTERTHSSSSSPNVLPVEEKKMRPPWASSSVIYLLPHTSFRGAAQRRARNPYPLCRGYGFRAPRFARPRNDKRSFLRQQPAIIALVIFRAHAVLGAFALHALGVFFPQERILHVVGDRGAAFGNIHRGVVCVLFARRAGLAARIVRTKPRGEPEGF